jgi:hypothetical protein
VYTFCIASSHAWHNSRVSSIVGGLFSLQKIEISKIGIVQSDIIQVSILLKLFDFGELGSVVPAGNNKGFPFVTDFFNKKNNVLI